MPDWRNRWVAAATCAAPTSHQVDGKRSGTPESNDNARNDLPTHAAHGDGHRCNEMQPGSRGRRRHEREKARSRTQEEELNRQSQQ